jgi:hypothetical protein
MDELLYNFLILIINSINKDKLKLFIKNNVNLIQFVKEKYYYLYPVAVKIATARPKLIEEAKKLTHQEILEIIKAKRSDIYEILNTEEGKKWFFSQDFSKFFVI